MALNASRWNVSVWVEGATRPLESVDFLSKEAAERFAEKRRKLIVARGWKLKVTTGPVFLQRRGG